MYTYLSRQKIITIGSHNRKYYNIDETTLRQKKATSIFYNKVLFLLKGQYNSRLCRAALHIPT